MQMINVWAGHSQVSMWIKQLESPLGNPPPPQDEYSHVTLKVSHILFSRIISL